MSDTHIRLARPEDGDGIAEIYAPAVRDGAISFEDVAPDGAAMARRVASVLPTTPWLVAVRGERLAGYAYATPHRARAAYRWSVDSSVYVHADHRRQGVAGQLMGVLLQLLSLQGFARVHAGVTLPNPGSVGLHESLGFRPVGVYPAVGFKHGAWHDVGWWSMPLGPRPQAPAEPVPVDEELLRRALAVTGSRGAPGT